jgi:entericidin A
MIMPQIWSDDLMRKALFLAILATLAACNTVQGVGRDIESVGRAGKEVMH